MIRQPHQPSGQQHQQRARRREDDERRHEPYDGDAEDRDLSAMDAQALTSLEPVPAAAGARRYHHHHQQHHQQPPRRPSEYQPPPDLYRLGRQVPPHRGSGDSDEEERNDAEPRPPPRRGPDMARLQRLAAPRAPTNGSGAAVHHNGKAPAQGRGGVALPPISAAPQPAPATTRDDVVVKGAGRARSMERLTPRSAQPRSANAGAHHQQKVRRGSADTRVDHDHNGDVEHESQQQRPQPTRLPPIVADPPSAVVAHQPASNRKPGLPRVAVLGAGRGGEQAAINERYDRLQRQAQARAAAVDARVQKVLDDISRQREFIDQMVADGRNVEERILKHKAEQRRDAAARRQQQQQQQERVMARQDDHLHRREELLRERRAHPLNPLRSTAPRFGPDPSQPVTAIENRGTSIAFDANLHHQERSPVKPPPPPRQLSPSPPPRRVVPAESSSPHQQRQRGVTGTGGRSPSPMSAEAIFAYLDQDPSQQHQQQERHRSNNNTTNLRSSPTRHDRTLGSSSPSSSSPGPDDVLAARERLRRAELERSEAERELRVVERRSAAAQFIASRQQAEMVLDAPIRIVQAYAYARRSNRVLRVLQALHARRRLEQQQARSSSRDEDDENDNDDDEDDDDDEDLDDVGLLDSEVTTPGDLSKVNSLVNLRRQRRRVSEQRSDAGAGATPPSNSAIQPPRHAVAAAVTGDLSAATTGIDSAEGRSPRSLVHTQAECLVEPLLSSPGSGAAESDEEGEAPSVGEARWDEATLIVVEAVERSLLSRMRDAYQSSQSE